jgi:Family of unknown function (DUF6526)
VAGAGYFKIINKPINMQTQHYKNHSRLVPLYHGVTLLAILVLIIGSFINLYQIIATGGGLYSASLICLIGLILLMLFFFARSFSLKAQDRAIRAEENFRHFILTGKPLDNRLRMSQIIGLRFAGDEEFIELAQKAVTENLSSKQIKQAIKNWKADHHRV